jgi:hypothetical protein
VEAPQAVISQPSWYRWLEAKLEPAWPLMLLASAVIIGVTLLLIAKRERVGLAAWLTYLFMP